MIDRADRIYDKLLLWRDQNQDGVSSADELLGLERAGVPWIGLRARYDRSFSLPGVTSTRAVAFGLGSGGSGIAYDLWFGIKATGPVRDLRTLGVVSSLPRRSTTAKTIEE